MKNKKTCIIIGAAPNTSLDFLDTEDAFVIAADGGYLTAKRHGIKVDFVVGDLDSAGLKPEQIDENLSVLPREKDFSDVHVAVDAALEYGYEKIVLTGCLGGRCDHSLANIMLLEYIARHNAQGVLINKCNEITCLLPGEYEVSKKEGRYLSLIALDSEVRLSLSGLYYPLCDEPILRYVPIAISNEWTEEYAHIKISGGAVLLIFSGDEENGKC